MHRQYSMAKKLPAAVLVLCLIFGLLSWALLAGNASNLSQKTLQEKGDLTINQLVELIRGPLFTRDTISIQVALQKVTEDPVILNASVYDVGGQLVAQSKKNTSQTAIASQFSREIAVQDTQAGRLVIDVDRQPIDQRFNQVVINWLLLWALFTLLSTYGYHRYTEPLSRRLRQLTNRLPGSSDTLGDEVAALEMRLQPLLSKSSEEDVAETDYYCSLITATIKTVSALKVSSTVKTSPSFLRKLITAPCAP